ncbi:Ubiquitin-fold modifier-specific protease [Schizosaccharomyces pombe]|uniref:Ubiquitin carboxyl-terminal hydrolase mug105 n=1 Tax=Schizosaccharomyces pombe (strain 972 / ATCC 24843) TaxID=284812 RepID=MU105_SCHPO|nr:putative ubiquitin-fold modifier-specific protease [Schizosaccharomyces pombe]O13979.1 RecName: Full=Ubiquitin carboxyl-terminal hydrolase mug105; AltName: Full=Lys-48-selective deubiquitinase mug105; Short=DUB; AltName: Full=Meiotically up-regulated gene 105 protein [Schizosaccharomyces pombe 972h-]7OIY_A Chain A, Ubiquitin carboxyl-terminal hydrolase mug105 [Schizosaccharomyces pombe 972h-]7OIY_B Chain B, Ubiquitin carboxyl-terminal hydrolase mug105 [Schizosaccharomyces pombe 972h-]CAB1160|eukprot:NP_593808.1 putative ubiquitin-fold modifier-specific protease [Schizosaccharomyces pombe]
MSKCLQQLKRQLQHFGIDGCSLADGDIDYFFTVTGIDRGWGCGWRNIQMLISWLQYTNPNWFKRNFSSGNYEINSLQSLLLSAWMKGIDAEGYAQLGDNLHGKWIGATEVYSLFTGLFVNVALVDFDFRSEASASNALFLYVKKHFESSNDTSNVSPCYLQFQGHSIIIIGFCSSLETLVVLDPDRYQSVQKKFVNIADFNHCYMRKKRSLKFSQFQLVHFKQNIFLNDFSSKLEVRSTRISDF